MNDIMKFFGQQVAGDSFDQIKSQSPLLNRFVHGPTVKSKSRKPSTIVRSSRRETVCSAPAFSVRLRTMSACAENTRE